MRLLCMPRNIYSPACVCRFTAVAYAFSSMSIYVPHACLSSVLLSIQHNFSIANFLCELSVVFPSSIAQSVHASFLSRRPIGLRDESSVVLRMFYRVLLFAVDIALLPCPFGPWVCLGSSPSVGCPCLLAGFCPRVPTRYTARLSAEDAARTQ